MTSPEIQIEPRTIGERLRDIRDLAAHPGWTLHVAPMLEELEREHTEHGLDPNAAPEKRSEHIHAVHAIRKIRSFPKDHELELEASWKLQQKKRPTA